MSFLCHSAVPDLEESRNKIKSLLPSIERISAWKVDSQKTKMNVEIMDQFFNSSKGKDLASWNRQDLSILETSLHKFYETSKEIVENLESRSAKLSWPFIGRLIGYVVSIHTAKSFDVPEIIKSFKKDARNLKFIILYIAIIESKIKEELAARDLEILTMSK